MKLKQLIYTALRGQDGTTDGYRYYGYSEGVSDSDREEIKNLFAPSLGVRKYVEQHTSAGSLTQEKVDNEAPKRYAYLRLSSGNYCWCVVTPLAKDYFGSIGGILIHALVTDEKPKFMPIAVFDNVRFTTALSTREQTAKTPVKLPEIKLSERIGLTHQPSDNKLDISEAQMLLSCLNKARRSNKPLLLNQRQTSAYSGLCELFSYYSVDEAVRMSFSTYTDGEDEAKRFAINHLGADFDYKTTLNHRSVVVADLVKHRYTDDVTVDSFAKVMTELAYNDPEQYQGFKRFMVTYSSRVENVDTEKAYDMYCFVIADKYTDLTAEEMLGIINDAYLRVLDANEVAAKIEKYIAAVPKGEHWLELYAGLYRFAEDKEAVSGKVVGICFNDIISSTDGRLREKYRDELSRHFDTDLYTDVLLAYPKIKTPIIRNIDRQNVLDFIVDILAAAQDSEVRAKADSLFKDCFEELRSTSPASVRDRLLPAVTFNKKYFDTCIDSLYNSATVTFNEIMDWMEFAKKNANQKVTEAFYTKAMEDIASSRIIEGILISRDTFTRTMKWINALYPEEKYTPLCARFIYAAIDAKLLLTDMLATLLAPMRGENESFTEALQRVKSSCGEETFTAVIYYYTKSEGVGFVKSISEKFPKIAYNIVAHNVTSAERYVSIYIGEFYNSGNLTEHWQKLFEATVKDKSADEKAEAAVSVIKSVKAHDDSPIVTYMCNLYDSLLWELDHSNSAFISGGLSSVRSNLMPDSEMRDVHLFSELTKWQGEKKDKTRSSAAIGGVVDLALNDYKKCGFILKYYEQAIVNMAIYSLKKSKDDFLLKLLLEYSEGSAEIIWRQGFAKAGKKLRTAALFALLRYTAAQLIAQKDYRAPLLVTLFSGMKGSEFEKYYKQAKKKGLWHIIDMLHTYFDCLPENQRKRVDSKMFVELKL